MTFISLLHKSHGYPHRKRRHKSQAYVHITHNRKICSRVKLVVATVSKQNLCVVCPGQRGTGGRTTDTTQQSCSCTTELQEYLHQHTVMAQTLKLWRAGGDFGEEGRESQKDRESGRIVVFHAFFKHPDKTFFQKDRSKECHFVK